MNLGWPGWAFGGYKKYWCALDGPTLYICAKDTKHIKLTHTVTPKHSVCKDLGHHHKKSVRYFDLVPPEVPNNHSKQNKRLTFVANTSQVVLQAYRTKLDQDRTGLNKPELNLNSNPN